MEEINPYVDEEERARIRELVLSSRNEGLFTPQSRTKDVIETPGQLGGNNWGGTAADPQSGMMYVRTIDGPSSAKLSERNPAQNAQGGTPEQRGYAAYSQFCFRCHGPERTGTNPPKSIGMERFRNTVRDGQGSMPSFSGDVLTAAPVERVHLSRAETDGVDHFTWARTSTPIVAMVAAFATGLPARDDR